MPLPKDALLIELRVDHHRLSLARLAEVDRHIIELFIAKGRGAPDLAPPQK